MMEMLPEEDEVHLLDYLIVLAKHSRIIIYTSVMATVLAYLVLVILPNKYTATARILPPQQNITLSAQLLNSLGGGVTPGASGPGGALGGIGGMASNLLGLKTPGDFYVGMLIGDSISDRIIERFHLKNIYKQKYIEDARKKLRNYAKISTLKSGLIEIQVTDKDRQRSAAMANALVNELDKLLKNLAVQEASARLAFLEKERDQANQNLVSSEEALRTFAEQKSVIQIDTQTRGVLEYIARLRAEIDAKEVQIQVLRQQATPFNYDVKRMETEASGLKEKLQTAEKQWDQTCVGDACLTTSKVPALGLEYLRLYRDVKFQEGLYQLYNRMVELARLDMARDISVVQVVDQAQPPQKRSNPRLVPAIIAGMLTFFMMILVSFGREGFRNMSNREDDFHLSVLRDSLKPWRDMLIGFKNIFGYKRKL